MNSSEEEVVSENISTAVNPKNRLTDLSFVSRLSSKLARYGVIHFADASNLLSKVKSCLLDIPEEIELRSFKEKMNNLNSFVGKEEVVSEETSLVSQIMPKSMFRECDLVSAFTVDSPSDMTNTPYRLLHRLGLCYYNSSEEEPEDSSEFEEEFYLEIKSTTKKKNYEISKLLTMYSLRDTVNALRLLLESRFAIPICSKDTIELLRITQRLEDGIFLGEDKELPRVAILSEVKSFDSFTNGIMKDLFNLKTSFDNVETSSIEVGQGFVCLENWNQDTEKKRKQNHCIVIHIRGDFEPYWKFLTTFIDYLVVEDEFASKTNKVSHFMHAFSNETHLPKFITVWVPSLHNSRSIHHPFTLIEGSLDYFVNIHKEKLLKLVFREVQGKHREHSMHSIFPLEGTSGHSVNNLREMYLHVSTMDGLETYRSNILLLQNSFAQEGELQDKLSNNNDDHKQMQERILEEKRFRSSFGINDDGLIKVFLNSFKNNEIDKILLHIQVLSDAIAINIKNSKTIEQLKEVFDQKTQRYNDFKEKDQTKKDQIKKELSIAREKRNDASLSIRHLWREASLFYSSESNEDTLYLPQMAASCLIAGETLELYDGDANMMNVDWITAIFQNLTSLLPNKKIFVLSVLGAQSSGKSTLLNTMFGIQLATSVGQCTRGLTMTLVKTVNREEYDYVIIFDSEGVRSPEHHGSYGSVKRDNKIATLSILSSDAVILVIKGENDNALKDILPIVALAYRGSKLAEEKGGWLSSKIFAAYTQLRCNAENEHMLQNIFSQLQTTIIESYSEINSLQDLKYHTSVSFPELFSSKKDIQVFGCNTKGDQPSDVPNEDFSVQVINFREHIHKEVVSQLGWRAQKFENLQRYLFLIWDCLKESNFEFTFQSVNERHNYVELASKFENLREVYHETYEKEYEKIKDQHSCKEDIAKINPKIQKTLDDLKGKMRPHAENFKIKVTQLFEGKENQNKKQWKSEYKIKVNEAINKITEYLDKKLSCFLENQLIFDRQISDYLKKMKDEIIEVFKEKSFQGQKKTKEELLNIFNTSFNNTIEEARSKNPKIDVRSLVRRAYEENITIKKLGIDLLDGPSFWQTQLNKAIYSEDEIYNWIAQSNDNKYKMIVSIVKDITSGRDCYSDNHVHNVISAINQFLKDHDRKFSKSDSKEIHRIAHDLLVLKLVKIQENWEQENSIVMRLHSKKEEMQQYCLDIENSLKEVDIMASRLNEFFKKQTFKGFQKEVKEKVMANLKNRCWPKSQENMQGHMDLYLIDEVERKGIKELLTHILNPGNLKTLSISRLIRFEIETVLQGFKLKDFQDKLEGYLRDTHHVKKDSFQFDRLIQKFQSFKSVYIANTLKIEMNTFGGTNLEQLNMKFEDRHINAMVESLRISKTVNKEIISKEIMSQLKNSDQFKATFCRSCHTPCPFCKSPCFHEFSHKGRHDTFHQPIGLTGGHCPKTKKLNYSACFRIPKCYYNTFSNGKRTKNFDITKKYNTWLQPNRPVSKYRVYLVRRYNKEIAKYFSVKPTDRISSHESLDVVKYNIKRAVDFHKDFPGKN